MSPARVISASWHVYLALPAGLSCFCSNLLTALGGHALGARLPAHAPQRDGGGVLAVRGRGRLVYLAGGEPAYHDGSADHVSGALLAFRVSRHAESFCKLLAG